MTVTDLFETVHGDLHQSAFKRVFTTAAIWIEQRHQHLTYLLILPLHALFVTLAIGILLILFQPSLLCFYTLLLRDGGSLRLVRWWCVGDPRRPCVFVMVHNGLDALGRMQNGRAGTVRAVSFTPRGVRVCNRGLGHVITQR